MKLSKKDISILIGLVIGFFLFIYILILAISPAVYFVHWWSEKWSIIPLTPNLNK